ncbi:MAG: type II CAAX prenyl endopeptidase Rce1 family protein [Acidobacteriota bacterium]
MSRTRRLVSLLSLLLFTGLILAYLWWGKFQYEHRLFLISTYTAAIGLVLGNHFYQRDRLEDMGFRSDNLGRSIRTFGLLTLAVGALIILLGVWKSQARLDRWEDLYLYVGWAALQQHVLQNFLRLRSEDILGRGHPGAAVVAAVLFALYHLPNLPLVAASFLGGLVWCSLFMRVPSFPGAWLSQALLTGCLVLFFKHGFLNQFEVGKPGHRYEYYGAGVNVAGGYDSAGQPFIVALPGPDKGVRAQVRVFDVQGKLRTEWTALPGLDFSGQVAVGELGWGPGDEIVVSAGPGPRNPPAIQIFSSSGRLLKEIRQALPEVGYGAWVATGCGRIYVAQGPGPGRTGHVVELSPEGQILKGREFRYGFENGVRAAPAEPRATAGTDACSRLLVWGPPVSVNSSRVFLCDTQSQCLDSFETLPTTFGLNLTTLRVAPGQPGFAVAPGPLKGYPPLVQIFHLGGQIIIEFSAFDDPQTCGSNIAAVDTNGDGRDELVLGEGIGPGRPYTIRIFRQNGEMIRKWQAF